MSECRAPAELSASSQRHPAVSKLLKAMHSPDASRRAHALDKLSEVIGAAYGEAGAEVGQAVRNGSGIALLARLLADPYPQVQQQAMFVVGNLCSDSVDAGSDVTKMLLLQNGAGRSLIAHAFSDDRYTLTLACGALQNMCGRGASGSDGHDREWSKLVVQVCPLPPLRYVWLSPVPFPTVAQYGVHQRLEQLVSNDDPLIRRYASGCLNNIATHRLKITQMSDEALAAVKLRVESKEMEERRSRYAMDIIALAVRAMPPAARERRVAMAKRRLASALRVGAGSPQVPRSGSVGSSRSSSSYVSACTSISSASGGSTLSANTRRHEKPAFARSL